MSGFDAELLDEVKDELAALRKQLDDHAEIVDAIDEEPEQYQTDAIDGYLEALDELLGRTDLLDPVEDETQQLQGAVEDRKAAALASIKVRVDDRIIEEAEIHELDLEASPPTAVMMVPSPKVNQVRGSFQRLELEDGDLYEFSITQTLVADMAEDNTGLLKLILELEPVEQ